MSQSDISTSSRNISSASSEEQEWICMGCRGKIVMRPKRNLRWLNGKIWHAECLCCSYCRVDMKFEEICFIKDGLLLCYIDYARIYGDVCPKCSLGFDFQDMVRVVEDSKYHIDCFSCDFCNMQLLTGEKFKYKDGHVLCEAHSEMTVTNLPSAQRQRKERNRNVPVLPREQIRDSRLMQLPETPLQSRSMMSMKPYISAATAAPFLSPVLPECAALTVPHELASGALIDTCDSEAQISFQAMQKSMRSDVSSGCLQKPLESEKLSSGNLEKTEDSGTSRVTDSTNPLLGDDIDLQQKKRRKRTLITEEQLNVLEEWYKKSKYIEMSDMEEVSDLTGLTLKSIKIWFQNKRRLNKSDIDYDLMHPFDNPPCAVGALQNAACLPFC